MRRLSVYMDRGTPHASPPRVRNTLQRVLRGACRPWGTKFCFRMLVIHRFAVKKRLYKERLKKVIGVWITQ